LTIHLYKNEVELVIFKLIEPAKFVTLVTGSTWNYGVSRKSGVMRVLRFYTLWAIKNETRLFLW